MNISILLLKYKNTSGLFLPYWNKNKSSLMWNRYLTDVMQSETEADLSAACADCTIAEDNLSDNIAEVSNCKETFMEDSTFIALLYVFEYLSLFDLIRASQVSKLWNFVAYHNVLWKTVKLDCNLSNSQAFAQKLKTHGTQVLNLQKMRFYSMPFKQIQNDPDWIGLFEALKNVKTLKKLQLGLCPLDIISLMSEATPQLRSISLTCYSIDFAHISKLSNLNELELRFKRRCFRDNKIIIMIDLRNVEMLREMKKLKVLSLRRLFYMPDIVKYLPSSLESLVLGGSNTLPCYFPIKILPKMVNLKRLRLEQCQNGNFVIELVRAVSLMEKLTQLELVNFNIEEGFEKALAQCKNLKKLLIIPSFWDIFGSLNAHQIVINGAIKLKSSLDLFILVFALEFLSTAESVYSMKSSRIRYLGTGVSIPFQTYFCRCELGQCNNSLHIDMISLSFIKNEILPKYLPQTKIEILEVPFAETWEQKIA